MNNSVQLRTYKTTIAIGANKPKQLFWYFVNVIFFKSSFPFPSSFKTHLLKLLGANIATMLIRLHNNIISN
jgi:putative colanic acid biosynthesis acetyltransferase WcaF